MVTLSEPSNQHDEKNNKPDPNQVIPLVIRWEFGFKKVQKSQGINAEKQDKTDNSSFHQDVDKGVVNPNIASIDEWQTLTVLR